MRRPPPYSGPSCLDDATQRLPPPPSPGLTIHACCQRGFLAWEVENGGATPVWAFLLVPDRHYPFSYVDDAAFVSVDDGVVVVGKAQPDREPGEEPLILVGAIELRPAERYRGATYLGPALDPNLVNIRTGEEEQPIHRVTLELAWRPVVGEPATDREWNGHKLTYFMRTLPSVERSRSPTVDWAACR